MPCEGRVAPLTKVEAEKYLVEVPGWKLDGGGKQIAREFKFKDFAKALAFVNQVGALAESEGHHPGILIHDWNQVRLGLPTRAIGGLSENDFILAAKINQLLA